MTRCHIHEDGILLVIRTTRAECMHKLSIEEARKLREQLSDAIDASEMRTLPKLPPIPTKRHGKGAKR